VGDRKETGHDNARPIIVYTRVANCWFPKVNSIYIGQRVEDLWLHNWAHIRRSRLESSPWAGIGHCKEPGDARPPRFKTVARSHLDRIYEARAVASQFLGNLCKSLLANDRIMMHRRTRPCAWIGSMKQATLATAGFERYGKTTRRAVFLGEMERVVPWAALCGLIEPVYPKPGNGRPPVGVERMLRIYFLQQWFIAVAQ
jgi:hypothetical protein